MHTCSYTSLYTCTLTDSHARSHSFTRSLAHSLTHLCAHRRFALTFGKEKQSNMKNTGTSVDFNSEQKRRNCKTTTTKTHGCSLFIPDINECLLTDLNTCNLTRGNCVNTDGGFNCACKAGYDNSSGSRTCTGQFIVCVLMCFNV